MGEDDGDDTSGTGATPMEEGEDIMKPGDYMEAEGDPNGNTLPQNGVPRSLPCNHYHSYREQSSMQKVQLTGLNFLSYIHVTSMRLHKSGEKSILKL